MTALDAYADQLATRIGTGGQAPQLIW